jgi:hypothetical protein
MRGCNAPALACCDPDATSHQEAIMSAPATASLKKEILGLEKQYWNAMKEGDADTLRRLTADDFTMVMEEGISTAPKAEFVEMLMGGDMQLKSFRLDETGAIARELSPGVVVLAYSADTEFEREGTPESRHDYFSTTWVKDGGGWQAAAGAALRASSAG